MNRRSFATILSTMVVGIFGIKLRPSTQPSAVVPPAMVWTRKLSIQYSPELAQDLHFHAGIDGDKEVSVMLSQEIFREIGTERGTIQKKLVYDPDTFQPIHYFMFRNDGKYGREDGWGLPLLKV